MIDVRKVRDPDDDRKFRPGEYEAFITLPELGRVLFGHIARTGRPGVDHYPWEWWVDSDCPLPEPVLIEHPRLTGHTETKRNAADKLALIAKAAKAVLDPPEASELDGWVDPDQFSLDGPITAGDVEAILQRAVELAEVWLLDHDGDPLDDRVALYAMLTDLTGTKGRLTAVADHLRDELHPELRSRDVPVVEVEGRLWRAGNRKARKGYDKQAIRSKVNSAALAPILDIDTETGEVLSSREPHPAEAIDKVWKAADVATGRTKVLREEFDIDVDEYAESSWTPILVEVAEADLPPEELAVLRGEEVPES